MFIKLSGQYGNKNTTNVTKVTNDSIEINGELYEFPQSIVKYDTSGVEDIPEAHRDSLGELYLTIIVKYGDDTKEYWETKVNGHLPGELYDDFSQLEEGGTIY